jgi:F-box and leucine-rich repeat protein 1 (S-phase kinase-associated protein 2)
MYFSLRSIKLEYLDLTNSLIDLNSLNSLIKHCKTLKKISLESLETNLETYSYLSLNRILNTLNLSMVTGINADALILLLNGLKQ